MVEFFAEIGSNYIISDDEYKNMDEALKLIRIASDIGCAGVKFQYFNAEVLWHENMVAEKAAAKKRELKFDFIPMLSAAARNRGMLFGLSVFDVSSVKEVEPYVDYFKISSFEAEWLDLVKTAYRTGKRMMISIGQSSKQSIHEILHNLPPRDNRIDILHCVSKYPANIEECNLKLLRSNPWINGWSDHTVRIDVIMVALCMGAEVIEFHLFDDLSAPEKKHSWGSFGAARMLEMVSSVEKIIGTDDWDVVVGLQDRTYKVNPITGKRGV